MLHSSIVVVFFLASIIICRYSSGFNIEFQYVITGPVALIFQSLILMLARSLNSLISLRLRRSLVGSAAKTLSRVRLQYRQLRRLEPKCQ